MNKDPSQESDQINDQPGEKTPVSTNRRRFVPPSWICVVALLCFVLIGVLKVGAPNWDHANVNVGVLILSFIALMTLFIWFVLFSRYPGLLRLLAVLSSGGMVLLAVLTLQIDHVSGELIPVFRFRWNQPLDRRLDAPRHVSGQGPVEMESTTEHDFPQFLGPNRNATVEGIDLARDWQAQPPKLLWKQPIGAGWSGFSVVNGFAVTMEQRGDQELVTCYEVKTGQLRWSHANKVRHETVLGGVGPRCTPTIHQGKVYALGGEGTLYFLNAADGTEALPSKNLPLMFHVPQGQDRREVAWGRSASPLVVGDLVVIPAGGPEGGPMVSLVAFDKNSGEQIWAQGNRQISYSSPTLATLDGVFQILSVNEDNVSGHDPLTGNILWESDWPGNSSASANVSQPVVVGADRLFLSKGYGQGGALISVSRDANSVWQVSPLWNNPRVLRTKFTNVAVRDGYVYGLSDGILECVDLETGQKRWKSGRYGQGQILLVGDVLLVQSEFDGVAMVEATPKGRKELGRFATFDGQCWNNLCLYGRYLLVRNAEQAACFELPLK